MNSTRNHLDRTPGERARHELAPPQIAFAQLLGDALARLWIADQKRAGPAADRPAGGGQQVQRRGES